MWQRGWMVLLAVTLLAIGTGLWMLLGRDAAPLPGPTETRKAAAAGSRTDLAINATTGNTAATPAAPGAGPTTPAPEAVVIRGRVIDGTTGEPIEGAEVWRTVSTSEPPPPRQVRNRATTNADGQFALALPANEALPTDQGARIAARKKGWLAERPSLAQSETTSDAPLTIVLIPAQVVAGRVRFADGTRILAGRIGFIRPMPIEDKGSDPFGAPKPEPDVDDPSDPFIVYTQENSPPHSWIPTMKVDPFSDEGYPPIPTPGPPQTSGAVPQNPFDPGTGVDHEALVAYYWGKPAPPTPTPTPRPKAVVPSTVVLGPDGSFELPMPVRVDQFGLLVEVQGTARQAFVFNTADDDVANLDIVLQRPFALRGIILDQSDTPMPGARIALVPDMFRQLEREVVADDRGTFFVPDLAPEIWWIRSRTEHYVIRGRALIQAVHGHPVINQRVWLYRDDNVFAGIVKDEAGEPVAGLSVSLGGAGMNYPSSTTDEDGAFRFENVVADYNLTLNLHGFGHHQEFSIDELMLNDPTHVYIFRRPTSFSLRLTVVEAGTGQPTTGLVAEIDEDESAKATVEDATRGIARIDNFVLDERPFIKLWAPGLVARHINLSGLVDAEPTDRSQPIEARVELDRPGILRGRVVSQVSGAPVSNAVVELDGGSGDWTYPPWMSKEQRKAHWTTVSDAEGRFELIDMPADICQLDIAPPPGYKSRASLHGVLSGQVTDAGDIPLAPADSETLRVRLVRGDGSPVSGVELQGYSYPDLHKDTPTTSGTTDADGVVTLSRGEQGLLQLRIPEYHTTVMLWGAARGAPEIEIPTGTGRVEIIVTRSGRRIDHIPSTGIKRVLPSGAVMWPTPEPEGSPNYGVGFRKASNLAPGNWMVWVSTHPYSELEREVVIRDGETTAVEIDVPGGQIVGRVVDEAGKPVAGAHVAVLGGGKQEIRGTTNFEGSFSLPSMDVSASPTDDPFNASFGTSTPRPTNEPSEVAIGLKPGTYTVGASTRDFGATAVVEGVVVPASGASQPMTLRLQRAEPGSLLVTVLDATTLRAVRERLDVDLSPEIGEPTEQSNGALRYDRVPPGNYRLRIWAEGYVGDERELVVTSGEQTELRLELPLGVNFEWRIIDASGAPIQGARCSVDAVDPSIPRPRQEDETDEEGFSRALLRAPARYTGTVTVEGKRPVTIEFTAMPGRILYQQTVVR